jgi:hypothetical protein
LVQRLSLLALALSDLWYWEYFSDCKFLISS